MQRRITAYVASQIYGMSVDRLEERFRHGDFRTAHIERNRRWSVNRSEIEWRVLRNRTTGIEILTRFRMFQTLVNDVKPSLAKLEEFFKDKPNCIAAIIPGGVPYALVLLAYFIDQRAEDVSFICLGETEPYDRLLIADTNVLLVDDVSHTGRTIRRAKEKIEERRKELDIRGIKTFIYDDFAKVADFWVRQEYDEHFRSIALNLR